MCDCDCDEEDYIEPEPEQPPGLPGWVLARFLVLLEPVYGPWHCTDTIDEKSGLKMQMCNRQMFRKNKPDGVQWRIGPPPKMILIPSDLFSE